MSTVSTTTFADTSELGSENNCIYVIKWMRDFIQKTNFMSCLSGNHADFFLLNYEYNLYHIPRSRLHYWTVS